MNMNKWIGLFVCVTILSACENLKTRDELSESEQRQVLQDQTLQQQKAQAAVRQQEYDEQFRVVNARLDAMATTIQQLAQGRTENATQEQRMREAQDQKLKALEEALIKQEAEIQELQKAKIEAATPKKDTLASADEAYHKKDWKQAIVGYQAYRDSNPGSKKYAEVTMKMGQAFQELGMKSEAKSFYEEIVDKYPASKDAKKAQIKLKSLKVSPK